MAWKTGRLAYKLQAPQHQAYDLFYKERPSEKFIDLAGRRCKKSTLALILHAEACARAEGVQTAYVAPVEKGLADYIAPIIDVVFWDCPADLLPRYREKSNDLLFPNGSRIVFNGSNMRQYRYMRGQKLKLATIDEMSEIDDLEAAVDDVLFPAVWDSHGQMALFGTPPPIPSPDNPVVKYVNVAKLNDSYIHASVYDAGYTHEEIAVALRETSKGEIDDEEAAKIVQICQPENGYSIQQIYEMAGQMNIPRGSLTVFLREFMAEFVRDESAVIVPEFSEAQHVGIVPRPVYYDMLYKGSGADLGVADKTVEIFGYYDFKNARAVIEREFSIEGADVRTDIFAAQHKSTVHDLGWENDKRTTYWSDNSNLMLLNDLIALHKIALLATEKEDKAQWLNLIRILFRQGRIIIHPSCKLLIATLNGAFWKDEKKLDYGRSKALGHMDALDALIYFIRNLNMTGNPFPVNYDISRGKEFDPTVHIYPPDWNQKAHTPEGRVLERVFGKDRFNKTPPRPQSLGGL